MSAPLVLVSHALCPYVQRAAIVLAEKQLRFERRDIDLARKPDWLLRLSPLGKTPVLVVGDEAIFESAVRARADDIRTRLAQLEQALGSGPYFAGQHFSMVDAVFGPVFRYFDVFDTLGDFGWWQGLPRVNAWRQALAARPSVQQAVRPEYPALLLAFVRARGSALSRR